MKRYKDVITILVVIVAIVIASTFAALVISQIIDNIKLL